MASYITTDTELTSVADAIRTKGGTSASLVYPTGFVSAINNIPTGGVTPTGTISITENGTYDVTNYASANVDVEETDPADDGKVHLFYDLSYNSPAGLTVQINYQQSVSRGVEVDWGDGSVESFTETSATNRTHAYATQGIYEVILDVKSGTLTFSTYIGGTITGQYNICRVYGYSDKATWGSYCLRRTYGLKKALITRGVFNGGDFQYSGVTEVELPSGTTSLASSTFYNCVGLQKVSLPASVTSIGTEAFENCYSIQSISIPPNVTAIPNDMCENAWALKEVVIPQGVTSIGAYAIRYCYSLNKLTIPSSVTSLGNYSLGSNTTMTEYHFLSTTPPTIGSSTLFGIPDTCKIYVPSASLSAYQSATNWSTYASYMVGE